MRPPRSKKFETELDNLDEKIARLISRRMALVDGMPDDYDSDGEGEIYFALLDFSAAEDIYHAIARIK